MQAPLQRLYKTKLVLLAVVALVIGSSLLFAAHWVAAQPELQGLRDLPIADIGSALFTSGLVVIFFEYLDKQDAELRAMQQLRKVLKEEAPAIRDAVVDGFAFAPESLTNVAAPDVLDRIIENCLAIQFGDRTLAAEIYSDIRRQVLRSPERQHSVHMSVALAPWDRGPAAGHGAMFTATVTCEYRVVPTNPAMHFSCVSDVDLYREQLRDPTFAATWYFEPIDGLDGASIEAFQMVRFVVDGKPQQVRRSLLDGCQAFTVTLEPEMLASRHEVTVSYTYRALVQKSGHLLHLDIAHPTKDFRIEFAYGGCGIRYVNVLDYVAAAQQPRITRLPASDPSPAIAVSFDGWVLPRGGVAFVWVLDGEMKDNLERKGLPER